MRDTNHVQVLHMAIAHALYEGFDVYTYEDRDWEAYSKGNKDARVTKTRKHTDYDISIEAMFPQTWGSTALGFGGIGGAAITTAYTIVIRSELTGQYCVYFSGGLAYRIERPTKEFFEDIAAMRMKECKGAKERYEQ